MSCGSYSFGFIHKSTLKITDKITRDTNVMRTCTTGHEWLLNKNLTLCTI